MKSNSSLITNPIVKLITTAVCISVFICIWESVAQNDVITTRNPQIPGSSSLSSDNNIKEVKDRLVNINLQGIKDILRTHSGETDGANAKVVQPHNQDQLPTNQSLEIIKANMTLLKVNISNLQGILLDANHNHKDIPGIKQKNPHPFKYILNNPNACQTIDKEKVFIVAFVHTAPNHQKRRTIIRDTWANNKYYKEIVRVVFVMGKSLDNNKEMQKALDYENDFYNDIVQEDFIDSYHNLTYKGIAGLKWVNENCVQAKFVLKTDDDIFVNMFTLIRHLHSIQKQHKDTGMILCLVWNNMKVMRTGKWKVKKEDFAGDYYPTYCSGSAFLMTMDAAIAMHKASYDVPFFWVDDFYLTGLLVMKAGHIQHRQFMSTYLLQGQHLEEKFNGPNWYTYVFSHVHDLDAVQNVWVKLVELATGVSKIDVKFALAGKLPAPATTTLKPK